MKLKKYLFVTVLSTLTFCSCQSDEEVTSPNEGPGPVLFTSTVAGEIQTKASGTLWDANDKIGVFMKKSSEPLPGNILASADNVEYVTSAGSGNFSSVNSSEKIFYPTDGSFVDFIAYYPHKDMLINYTYEIDVANQDSQEAIDFLYSNNARALNQSSGTVGLSFSHQLVKLTFNITASTGVSDLSGLQVTVSGMKTQADFDLATGDLDVKTTVQDIIAKTSVSGTTAFSEALVLPAQSISGASFKFTLSSGKTFTWNIPANTEFKKGHKYAYNITLKDTGGSVTPSVGWIETPIIDPIPNTMYVKHAWPGNASIRNYSLLYDTNYKLAYWVAYPLHSSYLGDSGRNDVWVFDPNVQQQYQPNLGSTWADSDTYDRGHQLPSGDRTANVSLNKTTFYYTNMTAQIGKTMNQTIWARLETQVRTWSAQCDTMYVVTGAMITTKTDPTVNYAYDKKGGKAAVPKYYYKALAKRTGDTYYTVAFKLDNRSHTSGDNFNNYRLKVSDLEEETGFKFFPGISASDKDKIVENQWR